MNASSSSFGSGEDRLCSPHINRPNKGIFYGDSPFSFDTPLLLIQLSLCAFGTTIVQHLLTPLGQSAFLSQIIAGVLLGPSLFGNNRIFRDLLFPVSSFYIVDTFAFFGVLFFLFILGVKTDLSLIRECGKKAVAIGLSTFLMPFFLNFMVAEFLIYSTPVDPILYRSIRWISSFQALSSFHVIVCLLADLKLMNSELGRLAISSSMISGSCSFVWVMIVFTAKLSSGTQGRQKTLMLMVLCSTVVVLFALFIFRPIISWMIRRTSNVASVRESHVTAIFVMVLGSSIFSEFFGHNFLFGPIILGMVIPDGPPLGTALITKLELFVSNIMLPIYFVVSGARIDFSLISPKNFFIITFLAFVGLLLKVGGAMLPSIMYCNMPVNDAFYLGLILGNQGIIEVLIFERAQSIQLIDKQCYSIMVLSMALLTGIISPIVKFSYKPSKRYMTGEKMTIQHSNPCAELRLLACVHYQEHTPSIINLFEATYPTRDAPAFFYVVHLLDLAGRSAPVLVTHTHGTRNPFHSHLSEHIVNALRFFEHENRGRATVYPFTAISPYASMHDDVCYLAAEQRVSIVIVLFHKHPALQTSEYEANAIRAVNHNIIENSPSSVGVLIDRGAMICGKTSILSLTDVYRVGVIFLGGPDDREALSFSRRMAKHPKIRITLIHFTNENVTKGISSVSLRDMKLDKDMINSYKNTDTQNGLCLYRKELVRDSVAFINAIRSVERNFDLILVGRRHEAGLPSLAGLDDWNEFPELGCVGDMLVSTDSRSEASVLVVQQAILHEENTVDFVRRDSCSVVDISGSGSRVSPAPGPAGLV